MSAFSAASRTASICSFHSETFIILVMPNPSGRRNTLWKRGSCPLERGRTRLRWTSCFWWLVLPPPSSMCKPPCTCMSLHYLKCQLFAAVRCCCSEDTAATIARLSCCAITKRLTYKLTLLATCSELLEIFQGPASERTRLWGGESQRLPVA